MKYLTLKIQIDHKGKKYHRNLKKINRIDKPLARLVERTQMFKIRKEREDILTPLK